MHCLLYYFLTLDTTSMWAAHSISTFPHRNSCKSSPTHNRPVYPAVHTKPSRMSLMHHDLLDLENPNRQKPMWPRSCRILAHRSPTTRTGACPFLVVETHHRGRVSSQTPPERVKIAENENLKKCISNTKSMLAKNVLIEKRTKIYCCNKNEFWKLHFGL